MILMIKLANSKQSFCWQEYEIKIYCAISDLQCLYIQFIQNNYLWLGYYINFDQWTWMELIDDFIFIEKNMQIIGYTA